MASGDRVEKRLVGPVALSNTNATVGNAVPAGNTWIAKQIIFTNTDGVERNVYLAIGNSAVAANRVVSNLPVAIGDVVVLDTGIVLEATERLYGYADANAVVNVTVVGWEKVN